MVWSKIVFSRGMFQIVGQIDEHLNYRAVLEGPSTIRLGLAEVKNVTSIGVRSFLQFIDEAANRELEYHECSPAFMDMINTFPAMLGNPPDPTLVKSAIIVYHCVPCSRDEEIFFPVPIEIEGVPALPRRICARCGETQTPTTGAEDFFTFKTAGD